MKESEAIKLLCPMMSRPMITMTCVSAVEEKQNTIERFEIMCNGPKCPVWESTTSGRYDNEGYCGLKGDKE